MKRRWRHGLRRRCDGQGKGSNSDQPDHSLSPCLASRTNHAFKGHPSVALEAELLFLLAAPVLTSIAPIHASDAHG
jgi:hypothetical protein